MNTPLSTLQSKTRASSFEECLSDFFQKTDSIETIAETIHISAETVKSWKKGTPPYGERYIRLLYFLEFAGYEVEELKKLDPVLHAAGAYIALDLFTVQEIAQHIGTNNSKRVFEYIRGVNGISAKRGEKLKELLDEKSALFNQKRTEIISKLKRFKKNEAESKTASEKLIGEFSNACIHLRTLGQKLLDGPRETRFLLREMIGQGKEPLLHTTWETLHRLLAERGEIK